MKYRKKPVVIEAIKYDGTEKSCQECLMFLADEKGTFNRLPKEKHMICVGVGVSLDGIDIPTLAGTMLCRPGDWIIKGYAGEYYPCKPDIFEATYEPV